MRRGKPPIPVASIPLLDRYVIGVTRGAVSAQQRDFNARVPRSLQDNEVLWDRKTKRAREGQRHDLSCHTMVERTEEPVPPSCIPTAARQIPAQEIDRHPALPVQPHLRPVMNRWCQFIEQVTADKSGRDAGCTAKCRQ